MNFGKGLDTKSDPKQVQLGNMLDLQNAIFTKAGLLQKRNGFGALTALPDQASTSLATFKDNLLALGTSIRAYSADAGQWINSGTFQPVSLDVVPLVRSASSQQTVDSAVASNGLLCVTWLDSDGSCYYQISDPTTGQIILPQVALPATAAMPRVFALGFYFIVTFLVTVSGSPRLRRIAIPINQLTNPSVATDISSQVSSLTAGYDGVVAQNNLYLAWNASDAGGAVRFRYLTNTLQLSGVKIISGKRGTYISVTSQAPNPGLKVWVSFWDVSTNDGWTVVYDQMGNVLLPATQIITGETIDRITSAANDDTLQVFYELPTTYSFSATASHEIKSVTITALGVVGTPAVTARGVGIASKAFYFAGTNKNYLLSAYAGGLQPSYFLLEQDGGVVSKLAYSNGNGYALNQILPSVHLDGSSASLSYLYRSQLTPVNKSQGVLAPAGIYAQNGINLVTFTISDSPTINAEIGGNLNMSGGLVWAYDGVRPVEQNFNLWPEDIKATPSGAGGSMSAQQYYYSVTYEWTDSQGNIHRSAPSIPTGALTTTGTSKVTLDIPTLRLTYKSSPNAVRIVIYRWSAAQQIYYQVTSVTSPLLNNPAVNSVTYVDTQADSAIIGNLILYTTGGVVENIGPPPAATLTIFKNRLWVLDAEDKNLLWYSKPVLQKTPVEMSDAFTRYIAPAVSAQGSTGAVRAIAPLDDKLIIFKKNAIYYMTGNGPDITGAQDDFSEPVFITGTVGCENQQSIVFTPNGLLFESDKGRWLLGRDLSTTYLGAPVEKYNDVTTKSAINVPGTNQVRMTLANDVTLMYDYFFNQWGTFNNIPAISSVVYGGLHTYLNALGQVFQETPGKYIDGGNPVLMSFTTGWLSFAGLQGFERAYWFFLLGEYLSPHKLICSIYDYDQSVLQTTSITPDNYSPAYGRDTLYGTGSPWGGPSSLEQWRVFLSKQKCQAIQLTISEVFDSTLGTAAGGGITLSGITFIVAGKGTWPRIPSSRYAG